MSSKLKQFSEIARIYVVEHKGTDNDGASSTKTVAITVATPTYTVTDEWPSPYNGVTPDSSLGLAFNNIGSYDTAGSTIYTCLRVFTDTIETKSYLNFLGNLLTTLRIFETTFDLVDADNLILKLSGYQELTAN